MFVRCRSCRTRWRHLVDRWFGQVTARSGLGEHSPVGAGPGWSGSRVRVVDKIRSRIGDHHAANLAHARQSVEALVRGGWHVGPVPYGYRADHVRVVTASGRRRRRVRLVVDPVTGPVVELIFHLRVRERLGHGAITRRLAADPYWSPPPSDSRSAAPIGWSVSTVRAILTNPVYTGRTVWGRIRRGRLLPTFEWIISAPGAHPMLVDDATFARAAAMRLAAARRRSAA